VLRLAPEASEAEAVQQAARLCQRAADEPARNTIRQAIQELTASQEAWTLAALLAHPRPVYTSPELDRLIAAHRRPPPAGSVPVPGVDVEEVRDMLLEILAQELPVQPMLLEFIEAPESDAEIGRQTAEALWQGLLSALRG
jgi:hypothetical protein